MRQLPEPIAQAIESGRVPSPPQLLLRLLKIVDDDQATMAKLAELVEQDPGLATRVLTVANSPALGRGRELGSLESCLIALGTRLIRSIATCLSIKNLFEQGPKIPEAQLAGFWAHSLMVAELSRALASSADYPRPEEAYLAGLLHDIGELILLYALGEPYAALLAAGVEEGEQQALESSRFGVNHGEIGTWLADRWELDSSFADGILFHHAGPEEIATAARLPQLVWFAHAMLVQEDIPPPIVALFRDLFGHADDLTGIRDDAARRTVQIAEALGLTLPGTLIGQRVWANLAFAPENPPGDAAAELSAMIGGMALLQPLQQDLFELESDAEVLFSLRESARILFDLNRMAILLADADDDKLSGAGVGGQPAIFRQVELPLDEGRSLVSSSALKKKIRCSFEAGDTPTNALIDVQFARAFGRPGLLCIPMIFRNRTVGVMACGLSETQYARLARRLPWLLNFGRIAAISLETLQEARDFRRQAETEASSRFTRQARRVIHEAGNPLGIIKSYLKILDHKLPEESGVRQELGILTEEIDRVADIVGRMSEVPQGSLTGQGLDIGELTNDLLLLYGDALFQSKGIRIDAPAAGQGLRVNCERDSIKQILLNLWKNASEALGAGRQIKISLSDHVIHDGRAYIQLRMDDNGPGMSDAAMRSIHRPADAVGNGPRGMGLSIVGTLARRSGIPVTCRSQQGKGTSIALLLPKFDDETAIGEAGSASAKTGADQKSGTEAT